MPSGLRNVWIEFTSEPGVTQGGLRAAPNLTRAQFINMLNIAFTADSGFLARHSNSAMPIASSDQPLQHGRYILESRVPGENIRVSDKAYFPRTFSSPSTTKHVRFRDQVRQRDGRCVITGDINHEAADGPWTGFSAAHIVPLALGANFTAEGFSHLINSPQNGILLRRDIHNQWDAYSLSANPDDGYRVQSFRPNAWNYHGRSLHLVCRDPDNPTSVVDAFLRWHYEQAVLCNMRGEGEVPFEHDFPPGTDMIGEIQRSPRAAQRMEAELFNRLYGLEESR